MSFLGGAECSTASNPLSQLTKHTQDGKEYQRDRLVGSAGKGMQGLRSTGGLNMSGTQDHIMNEFRQHNVQLPLESFALQHEPQQTQHVQVGSPLPLLNGWTQEYARSADAHALISSPYHASHAPIPFSPNDFAYFQQAKTKFAKGTNPLDQQHETKLLSYQGSQIDMQIGSLMNVGPSMAMRSAVGFMPRAQAMNQQNFHYHDKGKGKMIELEDQNWEEQFKQIDLEGQQQDEESRTVEAELNESDQLDLGWETNEFKKFESIWKDIQSETTADQNLNDYSGFATNPDQLGFVNIGTHPPFRDPQLGSYMFEEDNIFKDIANPFEEGVRIVKEGGNLSLAALAFEAAIQKETDHVDAWVMLGSAQAQNEKETPAIRALEQALRLDPGNLTALMGLAVSYTNEGYDSTAYRTLERWLSYKYPALFPDESSYSATDVGFTDRLALHERVTDLFIRAAQLSPDGEHMDPDVQVGLGVLFYGAEEYSKAVDCFSAALASTESGTSNQQDQLHLLWNRLGATLANSGRSEEAIAAYEKALTLRANFVRARYNLGVSCINIGCFEEAASHLLSALAMHKVAENEGREKAKDLLDGAAEVTDADLAKLINQNQSTNLYDTLRRVFSQMGRRDLAERVAIDMDVESFRAEFDF
ncbi:Peroxisomal targeting signal receptor [Podosphaera aphanis]|nr:Peroxisomal targeting signal receptor [Podosphaera aphanis]